MIVELLGPITTSENKGGDKFQAKVVSPYEISGAIIDGRVDKVTKPGRIKRRAELQLSFDQIRLTNERWSNFNALLTEVLPVQGDNVKKVDNEGSAVGKSSIKPDAVKVGAATGTGLVIGAIVAGPGWRGCRRGHGRGFWRGRGRRRTRQTHQAYQGTAASYSHGLRKRRYVNFIFLLYILISMGCRRGSWIFFATLFT